MYIPLSRGEFTGPTDDVRSRISFLVASAGPPGGPDLDEPHHDRHVAGTSILSHRLDRGCPLRVDRRYLDRDRFDREAVIDRPIDEQRSPEAIGR